MKDETIREILKNSKTIAMIGVSSEKKGEDRRNLKRKPANVVMKYMQDFGYKVYPINPFAVGEVINGEKVYESLESIDDKIDLVDATTHFEILTYILLMSILYNVDRCPIYVQVFETTNKAMSQGSRP